MKFKAPTIVAFLFCQSACAGEPQIDSSFAAQCARAKVSMEAPPCSYSAGDTVETTLGLSEEMRASIPIKHIIVVMQENRSFDHMLGNLIPEDTPDDWFNCDGKLTPATTCEGALDPGCRPTWYYTWKEAISPLPAQNSCLEHDPPHGWTAMHGSWNGGAMDQFIKRAALKISDQSDGHYVMERYSEEQLPFYYWLAREFTISKRYFASVLAGTWANRSFLYAGTSLGYKDPKDFPSYASATRDQKPFEGITVFDQLDEEGVSWGAFSGVSEGANQALARQQPIDWKKFGDPRLRSYAEFLALLKGCGDPEVSGDPNFDPEGSCDDLPTVAGPLPGVVFVDPSIGQDEHPATYTPIQNGEAWAREIYLTATTSPYWQDLAMFYVYDEAGGLADHVPPPKACAPANDEATAEFDQLGMRVPLFLISPWAKPGHISTQVNDHSSILRFIQMVFDLPALTQRDANSAAMLDLFDFSAPRLLAPPSDPPLQGKVEACYEI